MAKKYDIPEQEPQMVNEPTAACKVRAGQIHMSFDLPETFDEETFRFLLNVYASRLVRQGNITPKRRILTDAQLAEQLQSLPSFDEEKDTTTVLNKEDYSRFMRVHKPMRGIEKWL